MEKQIKDYLHLYLGCEVEHDTGKLKGLLTGVDFHNATIFCDYLKRESHSHRVPRGKDFGEHVILIERIKPILRKLSSMTEEELQECGNMVYDFSDDPELNKFKPEDFEICAPEQFHYLLSKGFWLFGDDWFDEKIIIDKNELT